MGYIPRFLADPVPGTGTSLWLILLLLATIVAAIVLFVAAFGGSKSRQH